MTFTEAQFKALEDFIRSVVREEMFLAAKRSDGGDPGAVEQTKGAAQAALVTPDAKPT